MVACDSAKIPALISVFLVKLTLEIQPSFLIPPVLSCMRAVRRSVRKAASITWVPGACSVPASLKSSSLRSHRVSLPEATGWCVDESMCPLQQDTAACPGSILVALSYL